MQVLLVDDHGASRAEVGSLLRAEAGFEIVGEAATGEESVRKARSLRPCLIVMDIVMPGMSGIEATRIIHAENPQIRILALSNHTGRALVQAVLKAGATGYVRKDRAYEELLPAIRAVTQGNRYVGENTEAN
ncbi:MAG: response regulator transcription factor [Kiritimatiellae bacterium]|nr:response regulator transcription factor [Kiritimatiellia bacterium]